MQHYQLPRPKLSSSLLFPQRLRSQLKTNYGSTSRAATYFQDLLGDMVSFKEFCELLRFLRIPFREEEAKEFFVEVGKGRKESWSSPYQMVVLREYLETVSPPKTEERRKREVRAISRREESANVDSAEFRSPNSSSKNLGQSSQLEETACNDRHLLYFLRDSIEHLFSQGKTVITLADIMGLLEAFSQKFDPSEVKHLFSQAEDSSGQVTRESFKLFWTSQREVSGLPLNPFPNSLFSKLRSVYVSFVSAYEDITQGGKKVLDAELVLKLAGNLGLETSLYDCQQLLPNSRPLTLHSFKTIWTNELHSVELKYCSNKTCVEPVPFEGMLCHKHTTFIQSQGSYVWSQVKGLLRPRRMIQLISELHTEKDDSGLSPLKLRKTLMRFIPGAAVQPKDLAVLSDYLKIRMGRKGERTRRKPETPALFVSPGIMTERREAAFYRKMPWTPLAAGFPKSSTSHKSLRSATSKPSCFRFPYPIRTPPPLSSS
jgi:hypothetical protein